LIGPVSIKMVKKLPWFPYIKPGNDF